MTRPAGVTRRITRTRKAVFGAACQRCPLRERCTTAAAGRTLNLHEHDAILRQARHDWASHDWASHDELRETYRQHRPMVERSIAWLIGPKSRCRQLRYRGGLALTAAQTALSAPFPPRTSLIQRAPRRSAAGTGAGPVARTRR